MNSNAKGHAFLILVERMRKTQKAYFAKAKQGIRDPELVAESKKLESAVDAMINDYKSGQMTLEL